jgi:hypothetical protein
VWVGPSGSAQTERRGFPLFLEIIFNAKVFPEKSRKYIDGTENTRNIPKIQGKFSEVD